MQQESASQKIPSDKFKGSSSFHILNIVDVRNTWNCWCWFFVLHDVILVIFLLLLTWWSMETKNWWCLFKSQNIFAQNESMYFYTFYYTENLWWLRLCLWHEIPVYSLLHREPIMTVFVFVTWFRVHSLLHREPMMILFTSVTWIHVHSAGAGTSGCRKIPLNRDTLLKLLHVKLLPIK